MTPKYILTKDFLIEHYINQKKSVAIIAKETGIKSHNSITQALIRHNLNRPKIKQLKNELTKEYLIEHYINQNKGMRQIVKELGYKNRKIITDKLKQYNIPIKQNGCVKNTIFINRKNRTWYKEIPAEIIFRLKKTKHIVKVSIEDIWNLYLNQNRKCALTGMNIGFRTLKDPRSYNTASLDRIDSSKGYVIGNIQWIHKDINRLKNNYQQLQFIELCKKVAKHNAD